MLTSLASLAWSAAAIADVVWPAEFMTLEKVPNNPGCVVPVPAGAITVNVLLAVREYVESAQVTV